MLIVVIGGSGSGKSEYAEKLVLALQRELEEKKGTKMPLQYVATMIPFDDENKQRIERHRKLRAGKNFSTIECPYHLEDIIVEPHSIVLLECMSNLVANELYAKEEENKNCVEAVMNGISYCMRVAECVVVVTNDVFGGQHWLEDMVQDYMQQLGSINLKMADMAEAVIEVVYTIPVVQKGGEKWKLL